MATKAGIGFTALDNGFAACDDPRKPQRICDRLSSAKIDGLVRKWLRRLPHPFTAADRAAGYRSAATAAPPARSTVSDQGRGPD